MFLSIQVFPFLVGPSLTKSDGSFLLTCSKPVYGVLFLLSMEFDNSVFFAFLFKETKVSPIAASSPELTCSTAPILWEILEKII